MRIFRDSSINVTIPLALFTCIILLLPTVANLTESCIGLTHTTALRRFVTVRALGVILMLETVAADAACTAFTFTHFYGRSRKY
jgi:hypothetical protein